MYEYATVSSSSYDPASLASKLTEKSAEGWTVAAIVPTGGDVTAFLSRESSGASAAPVAAPVMQEMAPAAAPAPEPVPAAPAAEPAGWAVAPDPAPAVMAPVSVAPATVIQSPMAQISDSYAQANTYQPAAAAPTYQPAPAAAPTPAVPAEWYADPSGRFELRYWDGNTWTEYVSTGGVQSTNPPVA